MAAVSLENWVERIRDPKIECMSRDEMADLQSRRLVDVVKRVYDNVPFYRRKMQQRGVEPGDIRSIEDIGKLPFTTKEDLRDNYPFGLLAIPKKDVVRVQGTSGTTGKLTIAPYSQKDVDVWGECVARGLTMAGLTEEDIIHVCYGYGLFTGGLGLDYGAKALGAMAIPMSAGNTKRQMMCMEDLGATAFACTPSYALYLAESIQEAGLVDHMKLKAGIHGAEPWTEEMRKKIESILHINCFDIYGLCEITGPGVAQDCIHKAGLHVHHDYFYPEVLDPATHERCADGETGELVFTTLAKEAMPLIRYRTKDLTSIDHSTCECGRTLPRISKFTGRTDDMKVIRGVNVFPTQVETALLSMGGVVAPHYLMIVDREDNMDVLTVMVEVDESVFSDEIRKLDALRNKIAATLKTALGVSVRVKLVEPKSIQRSEGKEREVEVMGITIQQLSVFLENREGRLDEVLSVLAGNDVNIVALSLADTTEYGMLRMIVSDPNKGKAVLKENGITAMLTDVVALRVPHETGSLSRAMHQIVEGEVNIEYMYAFANGEDASAVLKCDDPARVVDILRGSGFDVWEASEAYVSNIKNAL